jgi:hypothetical protein
VPRTELQALRHGDPPHHPPVPLNDSHPHNPRVRLNRPPEAGHVLPHSDPKTSDVRSLPFAGPLRIPATAPTGNRSVLAPSSPPRRSENFGRPKLWLAECPQLSAFGARANTPHQTPVTSPPRCNYRALFFSRADPTSCIRRPPSISSKELLESIHNRRSSNVPHKLIRRYADPFIGTIARDDATLLGWPGIALGCPLACLCGLILFRDGAFRPV